MPKKRRRITNHEYRVERYALGALEREIARDALRNAVRDESKDYALYGAVSMTSDELTEAARNADKVRDAQHAQEIADEAYAKQEAEKRECLERDRREALESVKRERDQLRNEMLVTRRCRHEFEQGAARHERARQVLQRVHINRADEIIVKPGNDATATAIFKIQDSARIADLSSIGISIAMPWANVDEVTKMLDVILSEIANKFDPSIACAGEFVER